jgi:hypothetical protein
VKYVNILGELLRSSATCQPAQGAELVLIFHRWRRQSGALFLPLRYKVLLVVENIPAHIWSVQSVQEIIESSCFIFKPAPESVQALDLSRFMVVAWAVHPELIPQEIGCIVPEPEPEGPSVVGVRSLFLRVSEIIHSCQDMLQFRAFIHVL